MQVLLALMKHFYHLEVCLQREGKMTDSIS